MMLLLEHTAANNNITMLVLFQFFYFNFLFQEKVRLFPFMQNEIKLFFFFIYI